jgi:hypothetical protein
LLPIIHAIDNPQIHPLISLRTKMHTILCNIKVNSYGITIQNQANTTDRLFPTGNFIAGVYATKDVTNDLYNIKIKQ